MFKKFPDESPPAESPGTLEKAISTANTLDYLFIIVERLEQWVMLNSELS